MNQVKNKYISKKFFFILYMNMKIINNHNYSINNNINFKTLMLNSQNLNYNQFKRMRYLLPIFSNFTNTINILNKCNNNASIQLLNHLKKELNIYLENKNNNLIINNDKVFWDIYTDNENNIYIKEKNKKNAIITKQIAILRNGNIENNKGFDNEKDIEIFIQEILDRIDFLLLKYRRIFLKNENIEILNNCKNEYQKLKDIESSQHDEIDTSSSRCKIIPDKLKQDFQKIENLYLQIKEELNSIKYPATRSKIKNDYYKILKNRGSSALLFKGDEQNLSINMLSDANAKFLVIQFIKENEIKKIITKNQKQIYKDRELDCWKNTKTNLSYYTYEELDSADFSENLNYVIEELTDYLSFIQKRKEIKKNNNYSKNQAILDNETQLLCQNSISAYKNFRTTFATFHELRKQNAIKNYYQFATIPAQTSITLKNIINNSEDIHIVFSKAKNIDSLKIFLLEGINIIKKAFIIYGDKVVKFNPKHLKQSINYNRQLNCYSQKELQKIPINEYLKLVINRINEITKGIKNKEFID